MMIPGGLCVCLHIKRGPARILGDVPKAAKREREECLSVYWLPSVTVDYMNGEVSMDDRCLKITNDELNNDMKEKGQAAGHGR